VLGALWDCDVVLVLKDIETPRTAKRSRVAQEALVGYNPISDRIIMTTFRSFTGELIVI